MEKLRIPVISDFLRRRRAGAFASETAFRFSKLDAPDALVRDAASSRFYSGSLTRAALELGKPVSEVTALDLLDYPRDDLPFGPPSEMGGEVPGRVRREPISETRARAAIGRQLVDECAQRMRQKQSGTPE